MKMQTYKWLVTITLILSHQIAYSQLKVGDNPANITKSAILELQSANQGLLLSRIADTTLVSNPPDGMVIYYTPTKQVLIRANGGWKAIVDNTAASAAYVDLTSAQTISGAKTFSNNVILTGTPTGSVSDSVLTINGGIVKKLPFSSVSPIPATRTISTTAPLSGGGDLSANRTLAIADAVADGATKGAATFAAADFNAASGVVSIDYTNGTTATTAIKGFLTAADWTTFNNKLATTRTITTTAPLTGGGDLSANRTLAITDAVADGLTKGAATFTASDFNATAGNVSIDYTNGTTANTTTKGFLAATDWNTFNNKLSTVRNINTTAPLAGGGDLTADRTITIANAAADGLTKGAASFATNDFDATAGNVAIDYTNGQAATTAAKGFLIAADWTTFNNKLSTVDTGNIANFSVKVRSLFSGTAPITYSNGVFSIAQANTTTNGYLSSTDWNTFNNKLTTVDTGSIANFSVKVRSLFSGTAPITYTNGVFSMAQANTTTNGYLSSADWNTFNSKLSTVRTINTTAPLAGGGDLSADRTITIANAAADGLTKGAASFATNDFDATAGNVAIDYTNGQAATTLVKGFLTAADWTTFNNKLATTRTITTTAPLTGGGDLSANRTLAITDAVADGLTKGASTYTVADFNTTAGNVSIDYVNGTAATTAVKGFLTAADWTTFNNKLTSTRTISTTAPLTGGGDLSANRTIAITDAVADGLTKGAATYNATDFDALVGVISIDYTNGRAATTSSKGFLTAADWNTFNNKLGTIDTTNIANFYLKVRSLFSGTAPVTYSNGVFSMAQANTTTNGYLSSADWNTFNSKLSSVRTINTTAPLAGGGDLSADRTLSIIDAAADGLTKGASTYTAADFNATAGNVSIDYVNGTAATTAVKGFLTAADWTTFNNKLATTRTITTTAPLTGGGDLSANRTISIANAASDGVTKGAASFTGADFIATAGGNISINYGLAQVASSTAKGFLTAADWNTFNNKAGTTNTWSLNGNAGIVTATDFLGTTDTKALRFRTNNIERMVIDGASGNIAIGTITSTTDKLNVLAATTVNAITGVAADGIGVSGTSNTIYGIYGSTAGVNTHAIYGYTTGSNSNAVYGTATTGRGIYGVSTSNSGAEGISTSGNGVFGSSNSGSGVYGTSSGNSTNAITGYTTALSANGVSGTSSSGIGIIGNSTSGYGVSGTSTASAGVIGSSTNSYGILGVSYNSDAISGTAVAGIGVSGVSSSGTGISGTSTSGIGVYGSSSSTYGVSGASSSNFGSAIYGNGTGTSTHGVFGNSATGHGIIGSSNATAKVGVYGLNTNATGTGVVGLANGLSAGLANIDAAGSGGFFEGTKYGVYAYAAGTANGTASIKTYSAATAGNVFVNYKSDGAFGTAGTNYKIHGVGTVGTVVKDLNNKYVSMHAPETPEILFEDYGTGKLKNGKIHIDLDRVFAKNIIVNAKHPLRVFIQLEGECNGVYVTNKTAKGFDVAELRNGQSATSFQYHIVGNRADEVDANGGLSSNADVRFDSFSAPKQQNSTEQR